MKSKLDICFVLFFVFINLHIFLLFSNGVFVFSTVLYDLEAKQINTKNWLQVAEKKWPKVDRRKNVQDPFYYYHSENYYVVPQITFNANTFLNTSVISDVDLTFDVSIKYIL